MTLHPLQWPDLIIAVLLAEGLLWTLRSSIYFVVRKKQNQQVMERVERMRPGALDNYRAAQEKDVHAPLG
jgi:hypothetical protein